MRMVLSASTSSGAKDEALGRSEMGIWLEVMMMEWVCSS